ncbi:hypothetical protein [Epilithonimonas vandammei]|uniref:hypothetical protein n=1 Tax=Epilithonimonas vandammei TaxID=2487072 RepID=UPI000B17F5E0|nr:hypothetical protein [Epilithonimonas vandammei]
MQPLCTFPILHFIKIGYDIIVWDIQYPIICFVMTSFLSTQQPKKRSKRTSLG